MMDKLIKLGGMASFVVLFTAQALAGDIYGYDVPKKYPTVFKTYQTLLTKKFKKIDWLYRLNGVSDPIIQKTVDGVSYLSVWACKPHDCSGNGVAFLATPDAKRVVMKIIASGVDQGSGFYIGNPSAAEKTELDARLQ